MPVRPVLVVQHEDACPPGLLDTWADRSGVAFDLRRCHRGEMLPASLAEHSGLILLGGEMGAYEDARYPWLTAAKSLVIQAVILNVPFLGLCLGHQLAAVALGGRVGPNPEGPRRGVFDVGLLPEAAADPLLAPLRPGAPLVHWNTDIVTTVPGGATVLARDAAGTVQALRFAEHAWGIQGHPEVTAAIVGAWGQEEPESAENAEAVRRVAAAEADLVATWAPVAARFLEATKRRGTARGGRSVVPLLPPPPSSNRGSVHHR